MISNSLGNIRYHLFNAGSFYSDGGASFGILPKAVWRKEIPFDEKNRIEVACNLMLLKFPRQNVLIDTGMGFAYDEKIAKIYSPQPSAILTVLKKLGIERSEIDSVILTHLHHDHIGGLVYKDKDTFRPMFPAARHYIQNSEWEIARKPDELNAGAYRYQLPLDVIEENKLIELIDGDYQLNEQLSLIYVGGHSIGSQAVRIFHHKDLIYYPGDILPQKFHLNTAVTSAYDISRRQTAKAKKEILTELKKSKGKLIFNHQPGNIVHDFGK